ncbi:MAG: FecR domain-containing protein, partial [Fuerstia sp.]|nr:FecR domain-containing protein [Fuerstiella sp.]
MNEPTMNSGEERLRRLLVMATGPESLLDEEIEAMLTSTEQVTVISDDQLQRVVGKVQRLLQAASAEATSKSTGSTRRANYGIPEENQLRLIIPKDARQIVRSSPRTAVAALLASVVALIGGIVLTTNDPRSEFTVVVNAHRDRELQERSEFSQRSVPSAPQWLTAKPLAEPVAVTRVAVGDDITTSGFERRRVILPDSSVLFVNSRSTVKVVTERRIEVTRGEVFVEVVPAVSVPRRSGVSVPVSESRSTLEFEVVTPQRTVTAMGTKFAVKVSDATTDVMVTQGKVRVSGIEEGVVAGERLKAGRVEARHLKDAELLSPILTAAPRPSSELEWTRELMTAATGALVPISEYSGGALVTMDPNGQSSKLSLRKYHVDVHIEDGFARTTIDQTYFNHTWSRLEGTFHFPLPTDASLSRLAMYVNGKLMEGGMAERQHARNTFEQIVHKMQDPALLEWVDGSTFKMRVFPLEPRQEKRIVLSYSQRLNPSDGQLAYRFPAGHTMDAVRDWSAHVRVRGGAGSAWHSDSHALTATTDDAGDLMLDA